MSRSLKKGPFVDPKLLKKVLKQKETGDRGPIKTWSRRCTVVPEFVNHTFEVHNGKMFLKVFIVEDMVGHSRFGSVVEAERDLHFSFASVRPLLASAHVRPPARCAA